VASDGLCLPQVPNCRSYTALIKLCALGAANGVGSKAIDKAYYLLQRMRDRGIVPDAVVFNTLIDAYAKAAWAGSDGGGITAALQVLELMGDVDVLPNTVTYTSLINAARHEGTHEAVTLAFALFRKMPAISRNHQTYTVMMHALVSTCAGFERCSSSASSCVCVRARARVCVCVNVPSQAVWYRCTCIPANALTLAPECMQTRVGRRSEAIALMDEACSHGLQPNSFMVAAAVSAAGRDRRQLRMLEERFGTAASLSHPRLQPAQDKRGGFRGERQGSGGLLRTGGRGRVRGGKGRSPSGVREISAAKSVREDVRWRDDLFQL
jgi:hypothetical protein